MKKIVLLLAFIIVELVPAQNINDYDSGYDDEYYEGKTFNIHLFAGVGYGNFRIYRENEEGYIKNESIFPYTIGKQFGAKIEYNFPYNEGKWVLSFEPALQLYKVESDQVEEDGKRFIKGDFNYQAIELPILFRRYYIINKKSRIFINGGGAIGFPFKSSYFSFNNGNHQKITYGFNLIGGVGFMYQKFGLEARWNFNRNITINQLVFLSAFKNASLILSYKVF